MLEPRLEKAKIGLCLTTVHPDRPFFSSFGIRPEKMTFGTLWRESLRPE